MALLSFGLTPEEITTLDLDLTKKINNGTVDTVDDLVKRIDRILAKMTGERETG